MTYQDIYMNHKTMSKGERNCMIRYSAISKVLSRYKRRITMLDIGASEGYFSLRAADDYDCVAVMIESNSNLGFLVAGNNNPHTILLNTRITVADLDAMSRCEHFDVVLALNILHHFDNPIAALDVILKMGDIVIIEIPPVNDTGACGQHTLRELNHRLDSLDKVELCRTPSHTANVDRVTYEVIKGGVIDKFSDDRDGHVSVLTKHYIDAPAVLGKLDATITSTNRVKYIDILGKPGRDFIHGINLRTYQRLNGVWPTPDSVIDMLQLEYDNNLKSYHGDIRPWNFILDGERTHLIDGRDSKAIYNDEEGIQLTISQIQEMRQYREIRDAI